MAGEKQETNQFEQLVAELDTMAKALPADNGEDDEKIQAAAAEGGGDGDDDDMGGKPDGDADDEGKPVAKSFTLTLEDGTTMEAVDGAEMVKSLQEQVSGLEGNMVKAMGAAVDLIKKQGDMLKSLTAQVAKLSGTGAGRKAVVSITEKAPAAGEQMTKSEPQGVSPNEFMAKAMEAFNVGKLTSLQIATAEACINRGEKIPDAIVTTVLR